MMVRPKKILWPTDFSALSLQGARYARGFRETFGAELHVIHVVPPAISPELSLALPTEVPLPYADDELLAASRARLAEVVAAQFPGMSGIVTETLSGHPWSTICAYAQRVAIDLIVVATHGRTGLRHVLIGSTAERIVQHAPCPVLVVKSSETDFLHEA